jgi:hypothetical protein
MRTPSPTTLAFGLLAVTLGALGCAPATAQPAAPPAFGTEQRVGRLDRSPSAPHLRYRADGRLYAVWTEDDRSPAALARPPAPHQHGVESWMRPSPLREALVAWSADGGTTWSVPTRVNDGVEPIQGEENGPKIAFGADNRVYVVWSIPGEKGDKTRANVRFAMEDGAGGFTPARTLNGVKDTARFPLLEVAPDGTLLAAWIDRRLDTPHPRQLYLMRLGPAGQVVATGYKVAEGLCECCRLGMAFADAGKTVYLVDRELRADQTRNHALRKSTDGGATFGAPVEIHDDGWQVPECPHSGPTIARDERGRLHVTWFTLGRSPDEAGVYYTVSANGGRSFAPRRLVHGLAGPAILHTTLAVGADGAVWLAWDNLDPSNRSQVFARRLDPGGQAWGPVQQLSQAKENAVRPALALSAGGASVAWTEIDGEASWVVVKTAPLGQ